MAMRRESRKGIVLLLVLSLLVLFLLMGVTFLILSSQFLKSAEAQALAGSLDDDPEELLEQAFYTVLRGPSISLDPSKTSDPNEPNQVYESPSVLAFHSLLGDMYGHNGFEGVVSSLSTPTVPTVASGNELIEFQCETGIGSMPPNQNGIRDYGGQLYSVTGKDVSDLNDYYAGCVLTFIDGPAKGISTRIITSRRETTAPDRLQLRILMPRRDDNETLTTDPQTMPQSGNHFVVNGLPFSGTGFGFESLEDPVATTATYSLNARLDMDGTADRVVMPTSQAHPIALMPNYSDYADTIITQNQQTPPTPPMPPAVNLPRVNPLVGGANESYDLPDYQNMHLAGILPGATSSADIQPSYHRRALINYWQSGRPSAEWNNGVPSMGVSVADFRRRIMMRPLGRDALGNQGDHPNFTGSNPNPSGFFDPVNGPWDVDNDGDNITDSNWLDLGHSDRTTSDGRLIRPLFAILCVDLDGRLNVNAHGSFWDYIDPYTMGLLTPRTLETDASMAPPVTTQTLPYQGLGYGTPEISLASLATNLNELQALIETRYGSDGWPGDDNLNPPVFDPIAKYKFSHHPPNFFRDPGGGNRPFTTFFSPNDPQGFLAFGLDERGAPAYAVPSALDWRWNTPYEMNLFRDGLGGALSMPDEPYSAGELERVLRQTDIDAGGLPGRLWGLIANKVRSTPKTRRLVTTHSFDVPAPGVVATEDLLETYRTFFAATSAPNPNTFPEINFPRKVSDLLAVRLANDGGVFTKMPPSTPSDEITTQQMLAPETLLGLRMDLNRPFGNGQDDSPQNNVVDEIAVVNLDNTMTTTTNESQQVEQTIDGIYGLTDLDVDFDGETGADRDASFRARILFARQLYVLMMTLKDLGDNVDFDLDGAPGNNTAALTAQGIAQWCINVVDFRDADSIMTPFEYDVNPFNGWDVDGYLGTGPGPDGRFGTMDDVDDSTGPNASTDRRVVWGCERPELLITETMAWHDRRTEDLTTETENPGGGMGTDTQDMNNPDEDYDQRLRPRGAFFVELFNPWSAASSQPASPTPGNGQLSADRGPAEFYQFDTSNNPIGLDLSMAHVPGSPVWRLAVFKGGNKDGDPNDPTPGAPTMTPERTAYFAAPTNVSTTPSTYFTTATNMIVRPGGYAVVGSAGLLDPMDNSYKNPVGRRTGVTSNEMRNDLNSIEINLTRRFNFTPSGGGYTFDIQSNGYPLDNTWQGAPQIGFPPIGIPMDRSFNIGGAPIPQSFTITEPVIGYPNTGPNPMIDVYDPAEGGGEGAYTDGLMPPSPRPYDVPFDATGPDADALFENGTVGHFATVHLQRLANPLEPFDATLNPYITVDASSVDMTAFNGVSNGNQERNRTMMHPSHQPGVFDSSVGPPASPTTLPVVGDVLASLQRGELDDANSSLGGHPDRMLWRRQQDHSAWTTGMGGTAPQPSPAGAGDHVFDHQAVNTMGSLNAGLPFAMTRMGTIPIKEHGYRSADQPMMMPPGTTAVPRQADGYPKLDLDPMAPPNEGVAFPWLTWNNRPFFNKFELLSVPATRASILTEDYSFRVGFDRYAGNSPSGGDWHPHLMNFFFSDLMSGTPPTTPSNFHRLLEYVHVPTAFVGAEKVLSPNSGSTTIGPPVALHTDHKPPPPPPTTIQPFELRGDTVSEYREPGRININTIYDIDVWNAIRGANGHRGLSGHVDSTSSYNNLISSRRGYGGASGQLFQLTATIPTFFANPFRATGTGQLVPDPRDPMDPMPPLTNRLERDDIDATLLRRENTTPPGDKPLFEIDTTARYNDSRRSPYFANHLLHRVGSQVTTRSNVYAIWITVGFFEVEINPANGQARLGQEYGLDTGKVKRHRAFYIFDRSVPVGFYPGRTLNVDRGVLVRNFIE